MDKDISILIVDEFSTMRSIIKNLLRELGFNNTAEADDGKTALPMLKSGRFADEALSEMPVLMVTAEAKRE